MVVREYGSTPFSFELTYTNIIMKDFIISLFLWILIFIPVISIPLSLKIVASGDWIGFTILSIITIIAIIIIFNIFDKYENK